MGLFDNLDPVAGLSSSNLFSSAPDEPGMLRKGLEGGKAAVVGGVGGALALGARAFGSKSLEEKGLEIARRAEEDAAPYAFDVRDVDSVSKAAGVIPYALGALAPFVAARTAGALAGGLLGRLVSGTAAGRNVGAVAGGLGVSAGLSAGNIFPDAVENNVADPVARSLAGGAASGLLDQVAPLAVLRRAGLLGKAAGGSVGGVKGAAAGAVKGFFQEGVTEVAQEAIERGAGGQTVTGEDAMGAYINAGVIGGIGGGALGGAGGVFKTRPTAPADTPSIVDPLRPPVTAPPTAAEEPREPVASSVPPPAAAPAGTPLPALDLPEGNFGNIPVAEEPAQEQPLPTIGKPQPNFRPPVTPAPTIAEETTARLGFPRIFADPRIAPYVDTTARAKLAEADAEFRAAPEKAAREFLEPKLADAREKWLALTMEAREGAKQAGRTKQQIVKERNALGEQVKGLERAVATLRGAELARGPEKTGSVALGQEIDVGQEAPPTQLPISPLELDTLRAAASAAPAFDRTAREVALLQGNVIELPEMTAEEQAAQPLAVEEGYASSRGTLKQAGPEERAEAFLNNASRAVDTTLSELVTAGALKPGSQKSVAAGVKRAFEEALKTQDVEAAKQAILTGIAKAAKGKIKKVDAEAYAQRLLEEVGAAPQEFLSEAAVETPKIRFTHWGNVPGGMTDPTKLGTGVRGRDWEAALEFGTLYTSAVVEGTNFSEPAVQVRTKYSGELDADKVFDATNYRQDPRWAAAQEKVREKYGPDFAAAMAQFQKDVIAEGYDAILFPNGQLRIFKPMKVVRADAQSRTSTDPADIARQIDAEYEAKGVAAITQLERMLGGPADLEVRLFVQRQEGGFAGRYRTTPLKDTIELAYNAKDILSLAAHEGFHRIETKHLGHAERTIIRRALSKNAPLYKQLLLKAKAYDAANGTQIAEEIEAIPQEAHAYGFEYWKRGELKVDGALERVFQKIRQLLERVRNYIDGLGFRSIEDVYRAIDMGAYAKRDGPLTAQNVAKLYDAIDGLESRADVEVSIPEALFGLVPRDPLKKVLAWAEAGGSTTWGDIQALVSDVQLTPQQRSALEDRVGKDERALGIIESRRESGRLDAAAKRQQLYDSSLVTNALFSELLKRGKVTPFGPSAPGRTSLGSAMSKLREVTDRIRQQNEENTVAEKKPRLVVDNDPRYSKAAITAVSKMPGRPHWIKRPADVVAMRQRIEQLALEGMQGRNWHAESAGAILEWAGYDVRRAATMAALISNFSPRTPVGLDLKKALAMLAKWEGAKVTVGAPKQHIDSAVAILRREGEFDEIGNPQPGGIKRQNFFRNLMLGIDPEHYSADEQGATIDMWMAHAFGYANDAAGSVNKSEYLFADREVKLLARQLGWQVEETQAAIWVAIKARGNAARSTAQKMARNKGWYVPAKEGDVDIEEDLYGEFETGKADPTTGKRKALKYVIAADKQRDYVELWMSIALQFKPSYDQFQKANYNYANAFRDIRNGVITLPEGVEVYGTQDAAQDTEGKAPPLQLFSKASLDQVVRRAQAGEVERTQLMASVAQALDEANLPAATYKDLVGATASAAGGTLKRGYLTHFSSGMNAAKNSKGFANVFGVLTAYTQRKNRLIADGVESKLSRWLPAKTDDAEAAGKALLDRTVGGYEAGTPEWQAIVDGLTQEQRALFDQATAMVADRLRLELEADTRTMSRALGADTDAFKEWLENRTAQVERLIREGYVPERRYGDHTVTITMPTTDAAGRTKDITVFHEQYESEAEAKVMSQRYLDALSSVAPDLKVSQGFRYSPEHDASLSYQQFLDMARRFGIEVSQAEKERLAKAMISADSVRRNRIFRRKNVPGYSGDALRVLSEFGVTMANKIAYSEFSEPLGEAQKGTQVDVSWENGAPVLAPAKGTNLWAEDGPASGFYRNLSDETVSYVMTPQKDSEWSRRARAAASLHFLGGSLAAGAVQLSSLPMVSAPYLSAHTGYLNAVAKLSSAFSKTIRNSGVLTNLSKLEDTGNVMSGLDEVPGLRNALIQAARDGTTLDTEIYQIMGMTRGGMMAKSRNVRKALDIWMYPFRKTEQWNRAATFIAAYNVGIENKLGGAELYKFAQEAVYNTQFRYDEANRPAIARNPIWAVMFTFKSYPIFMTEALVALAREKPQAAVVMLLSLTVAAGAEGLPFAEDIMDLVDVIAQRVFGSSFNSQRALRNVAKAASEAIVGVDLSGVFVHGLVNELTGLSFASRVGMGNLIPGTRLGAADADFKRVAEEIIGPAAGLVGGWGAGAGELLKGNFAEAFSAAAPTALKNVAKGASQWDKGFATDAGGRKLVDVGGFGAVMQGIGFAPAAVTHAYELDRIDKRTASFYTAVKDDFAKEFVKAIKDSDYGRISELTQAVIAWNTAHPTAPIALSASSLRRRVQEAGMPINERTLKNLPKQLRGGSEALGVTIGGVE